MSNQQAAGDSSRAGAEGIRAARRTHRTGPDAALATALNRLQEAANDANLTVITISNNQIEQLLALAAANSQQAITERDELLAEQLSGAAVTVRDCNATTLAALSLALRLEVPPSANQNQPSAGAASAPLPLGLGAPGFLAHPQHPPALTAELVQWMQWCRQQTMLNLQPQQQQPPAQQGQLPTNNALGAPPPPPPPPPQQIYPPWYPGVPNWQQQQQQQQQHQSQPQTNATGPPPPQYPGIPLPTTDANGLPFAAGTVDHQQKQPPRLIQTADVENVGDRVENNEAAAEHSTKKRSLKDLLAKHRVVLKSLKEEMDALEKQDAGLALTQEEVELIKKHQSSCAVEQLKTLSTNQEHTTKRSLKDLIAKQRVNREYEKEVMDALDKQDAGLALTQKDVELIRKHQSSCATKRSLKDLIAKHSANRDYEQKMMGETIDALDKQAKGLALTQKDVELIQKHQSTLRRDDEENRKDEEDFNLTSDQQLTNRKVNGAIDKYERGLQLNEEETALVCQELIKLRGEARAISSLRRDVAQLRSDLVTHIARTDAIEGVVATLKEQVQTLMAQRNQHHVAEASGGDSQKEEDTNATADNEDDDVEVEQLDSNSSHCNNNNHRSTSNNNSTSNTAAEAGRSLTKC